MMSARKTNRTRQTSSIFFFLFQSVEKGAIDAGEDIEKKKFNSKRFDERQKKNWPNNQKVDESKITTKEIYKWGGGGRNREQITNPNKIRFSKKNDKRRK